MENNASLRLPFYVKLSQVVVGLVAFIYVLHLAAEIVVPLIFAGILSILLNPIVNVLQRKGVKRVIAILLAILLLFIVVGGILVFIGSQVSMFREALPELKQKATELFGDLVSWFSRTFRISEKQITAFIDTKKSQGMDNAGAVVSTTLVSLSTALVMTFLIPVYIFLMILYKPLLLTFFKKVFPKQEEDKVAHVLFTTRTVIQSYLMGLLIEMLIIAVLNSTALPIIGVDYAIVLGVVGALLNLVPYIGGLIAIALPMIMALITGTPMQALFVLLAYMLIQLIDNNYLVPVIVASKVKLNALVSIVAVLIGGAMWGVAGMFLAIPLTAILKVIFDNVPQMEAFGFLLGDELPSSRTRIFKSADPDAK